MTRTFIETAMDVVLPHEDPKVHKSLTEEIVVDACEREMFGMDNPGFCISCGFEQGGCEPDAIGYECESCGRERVYGAAEILLRGWV